MPRPGQRKELVFWVKGKDSLPALALGLISAGVGCYFYFSSIGRLPVQTVAVCGYLEPLSAVLFSVLFLEERLLSAQVLGAALMLVGAVFAERADSPKAGR